MDIIKNPIISGLIVSAVSYIYVRWLNKNRDIERDDDERIDDMKLPIILGIVTFLGMSIWFNQAKINAPDVVVKIPQISSTALSDSVMSPKLSAGILNTVRQLSPTKIGLSSGIGKPREFLDEF